MYAAARVMPLSAYLLRISFNVRSVAVVLEYSSTRVLDKVLDRILE